MGDDDEGAGGGDGVTIETVALPDGSTTTETVTTAAPAGGGGSGGPPPKSDFAKQADAICARYNDQIEEVRAPVDPSQLAASLRGANKIARKELADLRALDPPPGREATTLNFIAALERVVGSVEKLADATDANDAAGAQAAIAEADVESDEARRLAGKLGLEECGRAGAAAAATS